MAAPQFGWTTQPLTLTTGQLTGKLNDALRGLTHDLQSSVLYKDARARTVTVAPTWSIPLQMTAVTLPTTNTGYAQLFVDTADGKLKWLSTIGTLVTLGGP